MNYNGKGIDSEKEMEEHSIYLCCPLCRFFIGYTVTFAKKDKPEIVVVLKESDIQYWKNC
ncbi:hypothetical protein GCM10020331_051600 [Ectobacillus funiculus]